MFQNKAKILTTEIPMKIAKTPKTHKIKEKSKIIHFTGFKLFLWLQAKIEGRYKPCHVI